MRVRRVQVLYDGEACVYAGVVEPCLRRQPCLALEAVAYNRPLSAVKVVGEVGVRLKLAEKGQHILELPVIVAISSPVVEVVCLAAQEDLSVDRAGAARNLAARHEHRLGDVIALAYELPVVVVTHHDVRAGCITELQFLRQHIEVRIVRSSLQEQHRSLRVFREP